MKKIPQQFRSFRSSKLFELIARGGIGVMPTDTIYGVIGSALSKKAVSRIYAVRGRKATKPCIVLIGSLLDCKMLGVEIAPKIRPLLQKLWPGTVSIILPCPSKKMQYLSRGTQTLALRMPRDKSVRLFLKKTGPLLAPSANPATQKPATTIQQAMNYFKNDVDFYLDKGDRAGYASSIIRFKENKIEVIRKGAGKLHI